MFFHEVIIMKLVKNIINIARISINEKFEIEIFIYLFHVVRYYITHKAEIGPNKCIRKMKVLK